MLDQNNNAIHLIYFFLQVISFKKKSGFFADFFVFIFVFLILLSRRQGGKGDLLSKSEDPGFIPRTVKGQML